jgi:hypothetical protein
MATVGGQRLLAQHAARDRTVASGRHDDRTRSDDVMAGNLTGNLAGIVSAGETSAVATTDDAAAESTHAVLQSLAGAMRRSALARARAARPGWAGASGDANGARPSGTAPAADDQAEKREAS